MLTHFSATIVFNLSYASSDIYARYPERPLVSTTCNAFGDGDGLALTTIGVDVATSDAILPDTASPETASDITSVSGNPRYPNHISFVPNAIPPTAVNTVKKHIILNIPAFPLSLKYQYLCLNFFNISISPFIFFCNKKAMRVIPIAFIKILLLFT